MPSPSPSSRENLESLVAELEKTVTSLRKQVKLGVPMFVLHGVMNLSEENLSQHFLLVFGTG